MANNKEPKEPRETKEQRERGEMRKLPMMPIRDMVIFPYMMTPFVVGRESSVRALEEALNGDRKIFLATQHDASHRRAQGRGYLLRSAPSATSSRASRCRTATSKCWLRALERAKSTEVNDSDGFFVATVRTAQDAA